MKHREIQKRDGEKKEIIDNCIICLYLDCVANLKCRDKKLSLVCLEESIRRFKTLHKCPLLVNEQKCCPIYYKYLSESCFIIYTLLLQLDFIYLLSM